LGALLLFAVNVLLLSFLFFRFFRWPYFFKKRENRIWLNITFLLLFLATQGWMLYLMRHVYHLVEHSPGPAVFFKVIEINKIAIVKIAILAFLF
jgi:hypothetical protein